MMNRLDVGARGGGEGEDSAVLTLKELINLQ